MASIVRIKRRQSQEPAEALLLAAKRMKTECDVSEATSVEQNVFKFCGSSGVAEDYEAIAQLIEKGKQLSYRKNVKDLTKTRSKPLPSPALPSQAASSSEKKYKVLSAFRNVEKADVPIKVYDLIPEGDLPLKDEPITCNGEPLVVENGTCEEGVQYVYDFYYSDIGTFDDSYIDQLMSVQPYFYSPGEDSESDRQEESDDSNDENNYRNDYPDTESDENDEDDIVGRMTGMYIEDDEEASSDEEDFVYAKYDDKDIPWHSTGYLEYKRRMLNELFNESDHSSEDPDENYDPDEEYQYED